MNATSELSALLSTRRKKEQHISTNLMLEYITLIYEHKCFDTMSPDKVSCTSLIETEQPEGSVLLSSTIKSLCILIGNSLLNFDVSIL
jgi:hypothetical protein